MEQQKLSAKEEYEAKKAAREARRKEASMDDTLPQRMSTILRTVGWIGGAIVIVLLMWLWIDSKGPQTEDMSRAVTVLESPHIAPGAPYPEYNSNPPTSGPHYVQPAAPGFRGSEDIADEHLVHSLEHGTVWVSYRSTIPSSFVETLQNFGEDTKVVVTERDRNDTDIALAAWGRLDTFNLSEDASFDEARIRDFIVRYKNRGPERVDDTHGGI